MKVVGCGIPRSGSTLVWQILQAVFPTQIVLKTHPDIWQPDGSMAFVSIRYPRDVVASLYRVHLSRAGRQQGTSDDLEACICRMEVSFAALPKVLGGPFEMLRFEAFYQSHHIVYDAIEDALAVLIPDAVRTRISKLFSLEQNRARSAVLKDFNAVDKDHVHGDHYGPAAPGYWDKTLPGWALPEVVRRCKPVEVEWDYVR